MPAVFANTLLHPRRSASLILWVCALFLLSACGSIQPQTQVVYKITLNADGKPLELEVPAGTTAQVAVERAGLSLNPLDRIEPPGYTVLAPGDIIRLVRVREIFEIEDRSIPFDSQTVKNESLPEGQTRLIQSGKNGVEQITYRQVFEDDVEITRAVFKSVLLAEPRAEITMVGVQKPFTALPIPGRLVYMAGGNAWLIEKNTGERRPLVTSGDLDGRVFDLSPDGKLLLFTRKSTLPPEEEINTLWMINLENSDAKSVNLRASNIVHYASWVPDRALTVAYSTVEPRATAPGWQANNDLVIAQYSPAGMFQENSEIIPANTGGVYGWWGTSYTWSSDGTLLAYARPDSIGLVDIKSGNLQPIVELTPYQTGADWAWVSGVSWAPTHQVLYYLNHPPKSGQDNPEASPLFDLTAAVIADGPSIILAPQSGMFAYPVTSPLLTDGTYRLAYLQSIFPEQSDTGRYRLFIVDRDGSNRTTLFPPEGMPGLEPQQIVWSSLTDADNSHWIALTYQGNLWLINPADGNVQQVTGDGLIKRIDW